MPPLRSRALWGLIALLSLQIGCSDPAPQDAGQGADTGSADTGTDAAPDAAFTQRHAALVDDMGERTLTAGQEVSPCVQWTLNNEEPIYINTVTMGSDGWFHHSNWFVVPEHQYSGDDGYFNCRDRGFDEIGAAVNGTVLFAQSTQAREERQALPEGVVIKVPPNHKVIGSLHLLNTTPREVTTGLRMQLDIIHPADVDVVVTPFRLTYYDLDIPPETESTFTSDCDLKSSYEEFTGGDFNLQLYWVLPHYHELGNYFKLDIVGGPRDGETLFELSGFNAEANGQAFDPPVDLSGATGLKFTCGYDNPRQEAVGWGIGDQEMCVMLGFAKADAMMDAMVRRGTREVGTSDGVTHYDGECAVLSLLKNSAQTPPSEAEKTSPLYVPETGDDTGQVDPIPECEDAPPNAVPLVEPTLTNVREQIFEPGCSFSACHDSSSPAAGLSLVAQDLHAELMNHELMTNTDKPLVAPGDSAGSWLHEVTSNCEPQTNGGMTAYMPRNSPTLMDAELVGLIREWIDQGAQDN